ARHAGAGTLAAVARHAVHPVGLLLSVRDRRPAEEPWMSRLHLHRAGRRRPGVPILILLHGWSCHGGFYGPQLEALGGLTEVIAPDLPGHGKTADAVTPGIEAGADALAETMQEEGIADAVLVGWSMGALVAWSMIERHGSGRIAALVVEDMAPRVI